MGSANRHIDYYFTTVVEDSSRNMVLCYLSIVCRLCKYCSLYESLSSEIGAKAQGRNIIATDKISDRTMSYPRSRKEGAADSQRKDRAPRGIPPWSCRRRFFSSGNSSGRKKYKPSRLFGRTAQ